MVCIHTVGNDVVVTGEVTVDEISGWWGNSYFSVQAAIPFLQKYGSQRFAKIIARSAAGSMKCPYCGGIGQAEHRGA